MIHLKKIDYNTEKSLKKRGLGVGLAVQQYIDNEVIKKMDPYTPFDSGVLKSSPLSQSKIGSGLVTQQTPYARRWYYTNASFSGAPRRGMKWFERMKQNHKMEILSGAARLSGGRSR